MITRNNVSVPRHLAEIVFSTYATLKIHLCLYYIYLFQPFYSTSFVARNISERIKQLDKMVNPRANGFTDEFEVTINFPF